MNTVPAIQPSSAPVALSISFNQDATSFAVGLETGFSVYKTEKCQLQKHGDFSAGIGAVEMLGNTNYLALVGGGRQPKFSQSEINIWDDEKQKVAITIPTFTPVLGVRLSRMHIVIALHNSVQVYKFQVRPSIMHTYETADNPHGLCCLSDKYLAMPGITPGQVQLVELSTGTISLVVAHSSPLKAMDISRDGKVLATASEHGTLIRIYNVNTCARLAELRRGVDPAAIFSLKISPSGQILAVTSDKSTLHVFDIPHPGKPPRPASQGGGSHSPTEADPSKKWGLLSKIPLLPRVFSDGYSFASAHFEIGDEAKYGTPSNYSGNPGFGPPKGVIGWMDDQTLAVIGAGRDGRWEKFILVEDGDGKRYFAKDGWKKYVGSA
ncbi:hypothetical protein HYALB_00005666 [Hymenoscyphus albidus]|uniref:SVP1-like protein 2 n=1 Tax=Hymenoscyphus albidus TaxID=595503 RepID=A0A9N9LPQ5_9HELO|nr:hypothetical protein HYALB_00005666 [Hymenoscyphus albidus]